jgi:hypothetical protein
MMVKKLQKTFYDGKPIAQAAVTPKNPKDESARF